MAHEFESGFFVKDGAWHGLGTVIQGAPTTAEGIALAGLDWTVSPRPMFLSDGTSIPGDKGTAIVRDSDGRVLSVVGNRYVPLQNKDAFAWFDPFVQSGEATLETAGSLRNGERVWVLAKIGHNGDSHADVLPGDSVYNHLLLANGHDGVMAIRVGRVRTRVVCANTLAAAMGEKSTVSVRHTHAAGATLDDLRDVMRAEHAAFSSDVEAFRTLAKKPVTSAGLREYVKAVFPESFKRADEFKRAVRIGGKAGRLWTPKAPTPAPVATTGRSLIDDLLGDGPLQPIDACKLASDEFLSPIFDRVSELVETGKGADIPGVRGTMWGAYNAVSEYLQYEAGRGESGFHGKRADSMLFGASATANALALQKALEFGQYGSSKR